MTRQANARLAGFTFLFYIAAGITSLALFSGAAAGSDPAAQLAGIARQATEVRLTIVLGLLQNFSALVLGVTLYAITRERDAHLALLGLSCRVAEGVAGLGAERTLGLLWLAAPAAPLADPGAAGTLGAFLLQVGGWGPNATFFAAGSTVFSWLLLRGRIIPVPLGWLGVLASVLLLILLPLQLAGLLGEGPGWFGPVTWLMWIPMLVYEVVLAFWLIIRGAAPPVPAAV